MIIIINSIVVLYDRLSLLMMLLLLGPCYAAYDGYNNNF